MSLNKKSDRLAILNGYFQNLLGKGYTQETYKDLNLFTLKDDKGYTLKVFRGTSTNAINYTLYRSEERMLQAVKGHKDSADYREKRKAEEKANPTKSTAANTAVAIRQELKNKFPGIKFSVTSDNFSMGNSVDIRWTDGPTSDEVDSITSKYQYGHFDGMTDMYESSNRRSDIPQAKYVQTSRDMSEDVKKCREQLAELMGENTADYYENRPEGVFYRIFAKTSFPATFDSPRIERTGVTCGSFSEFYQITFNTPNTSQKPEKVEAPKNTVQVIEYGKGLAVIGDFSAYYDKLIAIGGRYNKFLSCGRGIVFQTSKLDEIKAVLQPEEPKGRTLEDTKRELKEEVSETVNFLAELDVKMYGHVTEGTTEAANVQKVHIEMPETRNTQLYLI